MPIASVSPSPFLPTATAEPTPTPKPWPSHFTFQNPTNDPLAVVPIFSINPHKRATTGTIAFISEINTTKDIYLMDSNGENRRNISDYLPYEESPVGRPMANKLLIALWRIAVNLTEIFLGHCLSQTRRSGSTQVQRGLPNIWNPFLTGQIRSDCRWPVPISSNPALPDVAADLSRANPFAVGPNQP